MTIWHEDRMLIDGELVAAEGNATYDNINPATEEVLGTSPNASLGDAERAIKAARKAFDTTDWSTNTELRYHCMAQLLEAIEANFDKLGDILVAEVGAPKQILQQAQLAGPIEVFRYYTDMVKTYEFVEDLGNYSSFAGTSHRWVEKEAAGVVGAIAGYNYPIQLALAKLAPALAAGCTVVLKGAPTTPWSMLALGNLIHEHTDIPAGVVNVISGDSIEVSALLTKHVDIDLVTFTGSTPVGRAIMAAASDTIKRVFLELGGKSATILLEGGDVNLAAAMGAFSVTSHSGQGCAIGSRLLVPKDKYDEVVAIATAMIGTVKYGDPTDPETQMGPLISAAQREKVAGYVDRAVKDGAKIAAGGKAPEHLTKGYFYEPTILINVDENSEVAQDELFGPVLVILPYEDEEDAIRIANNSIFGLSANVLGPDNERSKAVGRRIRTGTVGVNAGSWYAPDAPFGGYKQSGVGRESGPAGLEEFIERKTMAEPVTA